jgi:hypothetical protein
MTDIETASTEAINNAAKHVIYYGCWSQPGHFCWKPDGRWTANQHPSPWDNFYALCPGYVDTYNMGAQAQGEAALHHKEGWTALAFWDRSVDQRFNCVSVFMMYGTLTGPDAIAAARAAFPTIWARYKFQVRIVSAPSVLKR